MTARQIYCWNCGEDMGLASKYSCPRDTCGKQECERAARDAEREEREQAHRDLDDSMGWEQP